MPGYEVSRAKIEEDHHSQMTEGTPLAPRLTGEMTELARKTLQLFDIITCTVILLSKLTCTAGRVTVFSHTLRFILLRSCSRFHPLQ